MKSLDFNKKYLGVPLALIILLIGIGIATAASLVVVYKTTIQGTVTVEETTSGNSYEVTVYETQNCQTEVSSIDLGIVKPGERIYPRIWIKNTGNSYIPEVSYPVIYITANEGWHKQSTNETTLEPGEAEGCTIVVYAEPDVQSGDYSGDIEIVAKASENS